MAGTLVIDTLNASSGVLATQNGMTGIAKAWLNISGATPTINGSFNVGSITKNATGDYTVNFSTAMPNANYSISGMLCTGGAGYMVLAGTFAGGATTKTTTQVRINTNDGNSVPATCGNASIIICGN